MNLYFQSTALLLLIFTLIRSAVCLNCKCTQSSLKTPCEDGICQASACLMLDHPLSGRHYACSTSKLNEGECMEKMTKSGSTVNICSCESSDYCNFKLWPNQYNNNLMMSEEDLSSNSRRQVPIDTSAASAPTHPILGSLALSWLLLALIL